MHYYYGTRESSGPFYGVVYHYDPSGNREIVDHRTEPKDSEADALDAACEWGEENLLTEEAQTLLPTRNVLELE